MSEKLLRLLELRREAAALERELGLDSSGDARELRGAPALAETRAYAMVAQLSPDLISVHARGGEYELVSDNSVAFFGWPREALIGRSVYELYHPDDRARIAAEDAAVREGAVREARVRLRGRDGAYRWVETRSRAFRGARGAAKIVCLTRDVHAEETARLQAREAEARRIVELERLTNVDPLTEVANRRMARATLAREIERSRRHRFALSVALFDVDRFAALNERHGRDAGDRVLVAIARALREAVRTEDLVARWGGEELLLVLPHAALEEAVGCAERVRDAVAALELPGTGRVTVSGGVAELAPGETDEALVARADAALARAKATGRDRIDAAARIVVDGSDERP